jgi:hypothetical protein
MRAIEALNEALRRRIDRVSAFSISYSTASRYDRFLIQASAVSHLWQAWVLYNQSIFHSCLAGQLLVNGRCLTSSLAGLSPDERMYCAQQYSEGNTPKPGKSIKSHLSEPNWGDVDKLLGICQVGVFEQSGYMMGCYGLSSRIKDLQLCRNTCAHLSSGQIFDFNKSRVRYSSNSFLHPSDMMNWIDPDTGSRVWDSWCGEMLTISELIEGC